MTATSTARTRGFAYMSKLAYGRSLDANDRVLRPVLSDLHHRFTSANDAYFAGELIMPLLCFATLDTPDRPARYQAARGADVDRIEFNPRLVDGTLTQRSHLTPDGARRYLHDVLLHETIHVAHYQLAPVDDVDRLADGGHGAWFASEANRIGTILGLPPVDAASGRTARTARTAQRPPCSAWPRNVRPSGYYH